MTVLSFSGTDLLTLAVKWSRFIRRAFNLTVITPLPIQEVCCTCCTCYCTHVLHDYQVYSLLAERRLLVILVSMVVLMSSHFQSIRFHKMLYKKNKYCASLQ